MAISRASSTVVEEEDKLCTLCLTEPREVRFGCGHAIACEGCTVRLIEHSTQKHLKCPTCNVEVEKLLTEKAKTGEKQPPHIARQATFKKADLAIRFYGKTIEAFIDEQLESTDPTRKASAEAAKRAWTNVPRAAMPYVPIAPRPCTRALVLVLAISLFASFYWGLITVDRAREDFEEYVKSQEFDVVVTQLVGFDGPVNALVPDGKRCNLGFALCVDVLPNPTRHQRWWALVPSDQVGVILHNTNNILRARHVVFILTQISGVLSLVKPITSALQNQPRATSELSSAGANAMVGMALSCSLYGMFYDTTTGLVMVNYVPGYGYAWMIGWSVAMVLLGIAFTVKKQKPLLLGALAWLDPPAARAAVPNGVALTVTVEAVTAGMATDVVAAARA